MLSIDSTESGEVTPSLAQTCTKQPQILSYKGDSEQHQLPRKPAGVVACVHSFTAPSAEIPGRIPVPFFESTFQHVTRKLSNTDRSASLQGALHNQTKSNTQRAVALRVLATWEGLRADSLQRLYGAALPVKSPQCQNLGDLVKRVDTAVKNKDQVSNAEVRSVSESLRTCAEDSERLNADRDFSEAFIVRGELFRWVALAYKVRGQMQAYGCCISTTCWPNESTACCFRESAGARLARATEQFWRHLRIALKHQLASLQIGGPSSKTRAAPSPIHLTDGPPGRIGRPRLARAGLPVVHAAQSCTQPTTHRNSASGSSMNNKQYSLHICKHSGSGALRYGVMRGRIFTSHLLVL